MRPICVDHMTLPVGDLERSVAFYRAALVERIGWVELEAIGASTFGREGAVSQDSGTPGDFHGRV